MTTLHFWALFSFIFTLVLWRIALPSTKNSAVSIGNVMLPMIFLLALVLRLVLAANHHGFDVDITDFTSWGNRMLEVGPGNFYSDDYFSDYPPLYLYCLWFLGFLRKTLALQEYSPAQLALIKLPSILADLGIGYLIYKSATKRIGIKSAICLSCIYLFQPAVILNSCLWGQVDSTFTLLLVLVCILLEHDKMLPAFLVFGAGVLLKPQMLIFAPVLILGVANRVFGEKFSLQELFKCIAYQLLTMLLMLIVSAPFGLEHVIPQYVSTLKSYNVASVNAYNFWTGLGLNWAELDTVVLGLKCSTWGTIAIVCAAVFSLLIGWVLKKAPERFSLMGAFLIITVFTFSVKMHERYLYPVMALLLLSYPSLASAQLCSAPQNKKKKDKNSLQLSFSLRIQYPFIFALLTCLHLYNTAHVLYFLYSEGYAYSPTDPLLILTGIGTVIGAIYFYNLIIKICKQNEHATDAKQTTGAAGSVYTRLIRSQKNTVPSLTIQTENTHMRRIDYILLLAIVVLYSCFALRDLGDMHAPETYQTIEAGESIHLSFPSDNPVSSFAFYMAPEHDRSFLINYDDGSFDGWVDEEGNPYIPETTEILSNVFTWSDIALPEATTSVDLTLQDGSAHIIELVFLNAAGQRVDALNESDYPLLFDEKDEYPEYYSFRNSMYFDEIYHARCAYEFIHGWQSYENTHPPFGKFLISLGIRCFGMNPFGWRIVGTLFGIAMLPFLFLFSKKLTGDSLISALCTFIFAFDFMHFTQTRIATIDVYIVFFIICMYYFLFCFLTKDYKNTPLRSLCIPLGLCGLSMGFGVASKWTGVYAGVGMGILFFMHLFRIYSETSMVSGTGKKKVQNQLNNEKEFMKKTKNLIWFCLLAFVGIPLLIYLYSYLPFRDGTDRSLFAQAVENQNTMFSYHSQLKDTHYFASPFYEWPFIVRPIWFYSGIPSDTLREGISSFGNPLVWWVGIPAFFYMIYLYIKHRDRRALFLIIGYLAQFLPWFMVTRITFIYHYFPSVIFIVLMIGYSFRSLKEKLSKRAFYIIVAVYAISVFALFLLFYPVLAGEPVELSFVQKYLKWFKTWVLVSD